MRLQYDKKKDVLRIILNPETAEPYKLETGNFAAFVNEEDELTEIRIEVASHFMTQALAAGIKVENAPLAPKQEGAPVWEDVDSSMINAFKYDEATGILQVLFRRTGVYQYFDVPPDVVNGLRQASSKGSYMRSMIIDVYAYTKGG